MPITKRQQNQRRNYENQTRLNNIKQRLNEKLKKMGLESKSDIMAKYEKDLFEVHAELDRTYNNLTDDDEKKEEIRQQIKHTLSQIIIYTWEIYGRKTNIDKLNNDYKIKLNWEDLKPYVDLFYKMEL